MAARLRLPSLPLFGIATAFGASSAMQAYSLRMLEDGTTSPEYERRLVDWLAAR